MQADKIVIEMLVAIDRLWPSIGTGQKSRKSVIGVSITASVVDAVKVCTLQAVSSEIDANSIEEIAGIGAIAFLNNISKTEPCCRAVDDLRSRAQVMFKLCN